MIITVEVKLVIRMEVANENKWLDPDADVESLTPKPFWIQTVKEMVEPVGEVTDITVVNATF